MSSNYEFAKSSYNSRQRLVCVTLGVAGTISVSTTATMANAPMPTQNAPVFPIAHTNILPHALSNWQSAGLGLNQSAPKTPGSYGQTINAVKSLFHGQPVATSRSLAQASGGNNLNLTSNTQSFLADNIANFKDITIQVGGTKEVVTLASKLTAGEVVAAEQELTGGTQTIKLSGSGTATGGTVTLNSNLLTGLDDSVGGSIGSLTISHGVKVIDTVSLLSVGSLSNYGSILTASGTSGNTDTISAGTILNAAGGNIGSYAGGASGSGPGGLAAADPSLSAQTSLTNNGTISSAGNLTINAPTVYNVANNGATPYITAVHNVNINTQTLNNSGVIAATSGNVNVASTNALAVNNTGGTIEAQNGNINLTSNNADLSINGGNFLSQNLNLAAGTGNLTADVGNVSGLVNASASNVFLVAESTPNLQLGNVDASGDPIMAVTGNLSIDGTVTASGGNPLTLIASGNIVSAAGNTGLDTSSTTGPGGNLTLVAGANFTAGAGTVTVTQTTNAGQGSPTGGFIDLTGGGANPITLIKTDSTAGNAGYVQMVAFAGSGAGSGVVTLPTAVGSAVGIDASSTFAGGKNGDVTIIAGATSGTAITIGNTGPSAFAFNAGNVKVEAFTPSVIGGGAVFSSPGGALTSSINSFFTSGNPNAADINIVGNTFITGAFTANTGGAFSNGGFQIIAIGPASGAGVLDGVAGQNVTINAGGSIFVGNIMAYGGGGTGSGSAFPGMAGGLGGNGGNVSLTSTTGSVTVNGNINVCGGGGGGGTGGYTGENATAGGAGGLAGIVTLSAASAGQNVTVAGPILAYDGGAGGAGGAQNGGVAGGGGGGGSAIGGGGGGGGGGIGNSSSTFAAGGGGGFGGQLNGSGGGGGGSFGNAVLANATQTSGGGGGNFYGSGFGGVGDMDGFGGFSGGPAGAGGGIAPPGAGGAGATSLATGGSGGQSSTAGLGVGATGGTAAIVGSKVNITVGGIASGGATIATPINIEASTLSINRSGAPAAATSANINSTSGVLLSVTSANAGLSGTMQITNGPTSTIPGASGGAIQIASASGGTVTITTQGTSATAGTNDITITGTIFGGTANLTTGIGGAITTNGPNQIGTTTASLNAAGPITVSTNVNNLTANSTGGSVNVTQSALALSLGASGSASGSNFTVTAQGLINVTGAVSAGTGAIQLTTTGAITDSTKGAILTGSSVGLTAGTSVGTAANPILTNANSIVGQTGATGNLAVTDSNAGTLTFDAQTVSSGTLTLNSVATQLNIVEAPYANVAITDSGTGANVLLNSGNSPTAVFGGTGTFSIATTGNIDTTAKTTAIQGSSVSLSSSAGSIGSLQQIATNTGGLTLNASTGSVNVTDSQATSNVSGSADPTVGTFTLSDTAAGGTGLTVGSSITGGTIDLSTTASSIIVNGALGSATSAVTVASGAILTVNSAGNITGNAVTLSGVSSSSATAAVTLGSTITGGTVAITGTNNGGSEGTAVSLGGSIAGSAITVTGKGSQADIQITGSVGTASTTTVNITTTNDITGGTKGLVSGIAVNLDSSGNSVGSSGQSVDTAAGTLTSNVSGSSFITQPTGNLILGPSSGGGTFSVSVLAGNLDVQGVLSTSGTGTINLTTKVGTLMTDANIGAAGASVMLSSGSDLTNNSTVMGNIFTATTGGNFSQTASGAIVCNQVTVSASSGTFTANGAFESSNSPSTSRLQLSSSGAFTANGSLGTVANPFNAVVVNTTGSTTTTIAGPVNASGTAPSTGLQILNKGPLAIASTAVLNDGLDTITSSSTVGIDGKITDTTLQITSTGAVTIGGVSPSTAKITTVQGTITAPTFTNLGTITGTTSLGITTSGSSTALTNGATGQILGDAITLTNSGSGQTANLLGGSINATDVTFATSALNNTGNINAVDSLTVSNAAGNISITGTPLLITTNAGGSVVLAAKGSITVGTIGSSVNPLSGLTQLNSFIVTAGGNFTTAQPGITVLADGKGDGGTVNIAASNILFTAAPAGAFALSANGTTGTGGSITLNLPGTATAGITIGGAANDYSITAQGQGGGGTVSLTTPGQLNVTTTGTDFLVNATQTGYSGAGATVSLEGTKGVLINGDLDTRFSPTDNAGNITIISGAKTAFAIGGSAATTTNGQINVANNDGLFGNIVTITDASGVTVATGNFLSGSNSVVINGSILTNNGTVSTPSLAISSSSSVSVTAGGTYSQLTDFAATSTAGSVTIAGATPSATDVTLSAVKGAVIFGTGATSLTAISSGAGGNITIDAKTLTISSAGLKLDAAGTGKNANGGTVTVDLTGTTNLTIGTGKAALSVLAANTGSGANGTISIITGGNLTVNAQTSTLSLGTNTGSGSLTLEGKVLHINDATTFATSATSLNVLSLTSNSSTAFALGGATGVTNGINDPGLDITAGQITVINNGGAIYNGSASKLTATSVTAPCLTLSSKGDIGKTSALLAVDASGSAASSLQLTSTGGNAYVSITGGNESYTASVSKTLQITSTGPGTLAATTNVSAKTLNLTANAISSFTSNATSIAANVTSGGFTVVDSQTGLLTLNSIVSPQGISVSSGGAITAASPLSAIGAGGTISLTGGGTITTKGAISASTNVTLQAGGTAGAIALGAGVTAGAANAATLTAGGKGTITETKTGFLVQADTVNLNGSTGNIGTSHTTPFRVSAALLNINDTGTAASAYINNSAANASIGPLGATVGKTFDYAGALFGTTATIDAPTILISSSNIALTTGIATNATSLQITATAGNITVTDSQTNSVKLNTLTASAVTAQVSVTSGGTITTAGVITGTNGVTLAAGGVGNVVIGNAVTSTTGAATVTTASGTGTISDAGSGTYKVAGTSVDLSTTGENIGSAKVSFRTATPILSLTTGTAGSVTVTNTSAAAAGTDTLQTANVGSLALTDTSTNTKNTGTLVIGNIAASATSGAITISTNEKTLSVADTSTITTTDGNITLLDTYAANGANVPLISIGGPTGPTLIKALGVIDTPTGNVYIALGAVPATSTLKQGTAPTGGTPPPNITGLGTTVFFGTTSNPNGSITTGNTDVLTGTGSNLSFTTGKNAATQITLGNSVTIIADPPLGSVSGVITPVSSTGSSGGSVSFPTPTSTISVPAGAADCVAVLAPVLTSPSTTDSAHGSTNSLNSVFAASLSTQAALGSSPSIIGSALTNAALTNPNAALAAGGSALGNNVGATASNNAVNSLSTLHSSMPITQSTQPAISQTSNSQPFSANTLTGSASNVTHQTLDNGALLFNSDESTIVDTPYGSVNLAAGSVALLVAFDQGLAVYDLHDRHKGAIVLSNGTHSTALVPGHSVVMTKASVKSFEDVNPTQFVAYRNLVSRALGSENKLYQSEFDIMSMMSGLKPLRNMSSSDSPKTRKVMATMLKTAAILSGLTQGGEPFNLYVAPSMTAYAPSTNQ